VRARIVLLAHRSGVEIAQGVTAQAGGRLNQWAVHGRDRATRATAEIRGDISHTNRRGACFALFKSILLFGTVDLAQVVDAGVGLRVLARFDEVGNRDGRQEADDGHDDHDFHQGEARFIDFIDSHTSFIAFLLAA